MPPALPAFLSLAEPSVAWSDDQLIQACLEGQQSAWEALILKYKRLIYSIPFRYGASPDDAADIFQLVCLDLYAELPKLRRQESLRYWLMTVSARQSLKWKRSREKNQGEDLDELDAAGKLDPTAPLAAAWLAELERSQIVGEAVGKLSERCQSLIRLLFFADPPLPYEEIARQFGLAVGSIGFNRGRCLDKLRKELEALGL
jgi:RNA polymerase sigma factor (sigma-70 family)